VQHVAEDQNLTWEGNASDQARIGRDCAHAQAGDERKEVPGQQGTQQEVGEPGQSAGVTNGGRGLEQHSEHERVDGYSGQRIEHGPGPAEERTSVLGAQLSQREIPQELAGFEDAGDGRHEQVDSTGFRSRGGRVTRFRGVNRQE